MKFQGEGGHSSSLPLAADAHDGGAKIFGGQASVWGRAKIY